MDSITLHRKARLQALIESPPFNGSKIDFAKAIGKSKGRVSQMLDPDLPFGEGAAKAVCKALGKPLRYFEQGFQEDQKTIREPSTLLGAVTEIPLLTKDTAGMYREYLDGQTPPATHNYHSGRTDGLFAYSVDDDLMEPKIPKGCKAIINTRTKPAHGMFVLIQDGSTAYIRRLVVDGPNRLANSPHASRPLTGTIIGVVQELAIWLHDLTGEDE